MTSHLKQVLADRDLKCQECCAEIKGKKPWHLGCLRPSASFCLGQGRVDFPAVGLGQDEPCWGMLGMWEGPGLDPGADVEQDRAWGVLLQGEVALG